MVLDTKPYFTVTLEEVPVFRRYRGNHKPRDYRCPSCGRLIMRAVLVQGCYIEHRCGRCARMCIFAFTPDSNGRYEVELEQPEKG